MGKRWTGGGIREMTTRDIVKCLNDYEQRIAELEAANADLAAQVAAKRGGVIFQMEGEPTLFAITPASATPPGNAALWDNWRAEVAAWDALGDEAWAAPLPDAPAPPPPRGAK